ncbi:reverse transcriptase domain-containing protein [Tanacetum coccineum]
MPFGLKNAGATYQRLVDKAFDNQVGRNIEVYVDDLVIKSHTEAEMLRDIDETFCTLRKINMKLNPKKCMFGAVEGMFLGYMIIPERIKLCPVKTEVVLQLPSPRTIKKVQSLNKKLASLNRFLSKRRTSLQATKAALVRATPADGSGAGLILTSPEGTEFTYALRFQFTTSYNEAEYEALIAGLWIAARMGVRNVHSLTPITAPWPFYTWGIDIAGPFPEGLGKVKFLIVAIDYFTKWIEAKAVSIITAVIPAEIGMPTYRTTAVDIVHNDEELRLNLDLLEERRERATIRKLGPKWEEPYEVTEALGDEAYRLRSMDGTILSRTWNIANLKKCYL